MDSYSKHTKGRKKFRNTRINCWEVVTRSFRSRNWKDVVKLKRKGKHILFYEWFTPDIEEGGSLIG